MKTKREREDEFLADLCALLKKHGAEITIGERSVGYQSVAEACVSIDGIYDKDGNVVAEYADFELPRYLP